MQTRRTIFTVHSWLGISIGFVLAVMGLAGATLAFQEEIKSAMSPGIVTLPVDSRPRLDLSALIAKASAQRGGLPVLLLVTDRDPHLSPRVFFLPSPTIAASPAPSYIDPVTGSLLGQARGEHFFDFCESLHRWLALPGREKGPGGTITGIAALCMIFFTCSGFYLRWPRRPLDWRQWLRLDLRSKSLFAWSRTLHVFVGTWVLLVYLFSATTGLWFAFDWYQQIAGRALGAHPPPPLTAEDSTGHGARPGAVDTAWHTLQSTASGTYETFLMRLPQAGEPIRISALLEGLSHGTAMDEFLFDSQSGALLHTDLYAGRNAGDIMTKSPVYVHIGSLFGLTGRLIVFFAALTLPLFPISGLLMYRNRNRRSAKKESRLRKK